ncbi:MAG: LytTR family transcriptional regulator DNA-binding domain-containing protein [Desulfobacterales bacterium]|nr:MAG: LytTR family transcriptional regulator DNA-binding domain-containing protein [Desulfobacterales bacterium]
MPPDLAQAMERVLRNLKTQVPFHYLRWLRVRQSDGIRLIPADESCYFKAVDKYTRVKTLRGESLINKSIRELFAELDPDQFWRIHRGTIVNVSQIAKVNRAFTGRLILKLKDLPEALTVSRTYAHLFRQM